MQILNLTPGRLRQIRDVILTRRNEEHRSRLQLKEIEMRILVSNMHASTGNKKGAKAGQKLRLLKSEPVVPTMSAASRAFPMDADGLITPEQLAARQRELGLL